MHGAPGNEERRATAEETCAAPGEAAHPDAERTRLHNRHLRFGWWSLLCFLTLGFVLETMHGFKVGWYLDVTNEARRLMFRLAHAHGALLGLVHVAFALSVGTLSTPVSRRQTMASYALTAGSLLLPGGFFLGGVVILGGDPNPAVLLAPIGATLLLVAVFLTASAIVPSRRK